jgi:DnaK suppressor protein
MIPARGPCLISPLAWATLTGFRWPPGSFPPGPKPSSEDQWPANQDPDRGGNRQDAEVGVHERGAAQVLPERLLELQKQLRDNAGATTEHLRELSFAPDPADRATLEEEHALELRTRDRERKLLKKIDQALARIEDGSYGYCEETGEPIGIQRLLARPTATLTIEAQERREMKQKLYGE